MQIQVGVRRDIAGTRGFLRLRVAGMADAGAVFQRGHGADQLLRLGRILHAGQLDHDRLSPCCWISGSDTPSALMRLRSVPRFCLIAPRDSSRSFSGLTATFSTKRSPVLAPSVDVEVGVLVGDRVGRRGAVGLRTQDHRDALALRAHCAPPTRSGCSCRAAGCGCRPRSCFPACRSRRSGRPASGSARHPAGRGPAASSARRSRAASAARSDCSFNATV